MEKSKLDNQQKGILKCAPKNNLCIISCAIKRKTLILVGLAQLAWQKVFLKCASQNDSVLCEKNCNGKPLNLVMWMILQMIKPLKPLSSVKNRKLSKGSL